MIRQNQNPMMHDFGLPTSQPIVAARMASVREIKRAEEILAAARNALSTPGRNPTSGMQQNPQHASLPQDDFNSRLNRRDSLQWGGSYEPIPLRPGPQFNSGLQHQDSLLLQKQEKQALSLATASQLLQQGGEAPPMTLRQCQTMTQSLTHQNMVLESLLARQEDERLCKRYFDDSIAPSPKPQMEPIPFTPQFFKMAQPVHKPRTRRVKTFPVKLMETMMANYDVDIVAWMPDGRSFVVVDPDMFVDTVLKPTFKGCKYASFVRKLSRWGFIRLTPGVDCFYHPLFQREHIDLCARMLCVPRNESAKKRQVPPTSTASTANPSLPMDASYLAPRNHPSLAGIEKFFNVRNEYAF